MFKKLRNDKRGIVMEVFVYMLTVGIFLVCYFAVFPACMMLMDAAEGLGVDENGLQTIALYRNVFLWVGGIVVIGMTIWIFLVARKKYYVDMPV